MTQRALFDVGAATPRPPRARVKRIDGAAHFYETLCEKYRAEPARRRERTSSRTGDIVLRWRVVRLPALSIVVEGRLLDDGLRALTVIDASVAIVRMRAA